MKTKLISWVIVLLLIVDIGVLIATAPSEPLKMDSIIKEQVEQRETLDMLVRDVYGPCHECLKCHGNRIQDCIKCHEGVMKDEKL